jgi:glutathione synthase/RimK-type ligase-like ATP-grasp enzyme
VSRRLLKIAVHRRRGVPDHTGSWTIPWGDALRSQGVESEFVDFFAPGAIGRLSEFDAVFWHFSNPKPADMGFARSILRAAKAAGIAVFPDEYDAWHFDDKVSQSYLLSALGAPIPRWKVFFSEAELASWLRTDPTFPLVGKLRTGSGSHHVRLLEDPDAVSAYGAELFGPGIQPAPRVSFKAKSNLLSVRSVSQFVSRVRRIPEFLRTRSYAKQLGVEQGYVYLQEYIPNDGYDLKVVVVNGKTSFIVRSVRPGDFRASGGGALYYDKTKISAQLLEVAQATAQAMGSLCMGFDFVIEKNTGAPKIVEMSYGFSHRAILDAGGYWNREGQWVDEPLDVPGEIVDAVLRRVESGRG